VDHVEDKNQGVRAYKAHKQPVNCLSFDRFNPARLLSTSYDGYVRCLDFHTQTKIFDEVICTGIIFLLLLLFTVFFCFKLTH